MVQGIDVSHWQDDKSTAQKMDFKKAAKKRRQIRVHKSFRTRRAGFGL